MAEFAIVAHDRRVIGVLKSSGRPKDNFAFYRGIEGILLPFRAGCNWRAIYPRQLAKTLLLYIYIYISIRSS